MKKRVRVKNQRIEVFMATDPAPALRAEIQAALSVVSPQINGISELIAVVSDEDVALANDLTKAVEGRNRRYDLLRKVLLDLDLLLDDLNALEADGYPTLEDVLLPAAELSKLQMEVADINTAAAIFHLSQGERIDVHVDGPIDDNSAA